jgi:hypothetical protein
MTAFHADGNDVEAVLKVTQKAAEHARTGMGPLAGMGPLEGIGPPVCTGRGMVGERG